MFHCRAESELRHVTIYTFELIGINSIGLVPDANASISANGLIEILPRLEMRIRWVTGKFFQSFERAPILDQNRSVEIPEEFRVQESFFRIRKQGLQHRSHCRSCGEPFVKSPPFVNAHAD